MGWKWKIRRDENERSWSLSKQPFSLRLWILPVSHQTENRRSWKRFGPKGVNWTGCLGINFRAIYFRPSGSSTFSHAVRLGCPRERFLAINSGKAFDFLQAYTNAYYTQHIDKLASAELSLIELFLHGRVLWKFLKWQFRKFKISVQAQNSL